MREKNKKRANKGSWYFLGLVAASYIILSFFSLPAFFAALKFLWRLIIQLMPIFALVFAIMFVTNYYLRPELVIRHVGKEAGFKKWLIMIAAGILSSGPVYAWYPWLSDLRDKGISNGLLATFLYNRAIKISLLPLFISYFSLTFVVLLTILMIIFSVLQGIIMDWIIEKQR